MRGCPAMLCKSVCQACVNDATHYRRFGVSVVTWSNVDEEEWSNNRITCPPMPRKDWKSTKIDEGVPYWCPHKFEHGIASATG